MFACEVAVHTTGGILERTIGASDSANVTTWSCLNVNRQTSAMLTTGHYVRVRATPVLCVY